MILPIWYRTDQSLVFQSRDKVVAVDLDLNLIVARIVKIFLYIFLIFDLFLDILRTYATYALHD